MCSRATPEREKKVGFFIFIFILVAKVEKIMKYARLGAKVDILYTQCVLRAKRGIYSERNAASDTFLLLFATGCV